MTILGVAVSVLMTVVMSSPPYLCGEARCTGIGPVDYLRYTPLLPDVTGGVVDPRFNTIPLSDNLTGVRLVRGWRRPYRPGRLERVMASRSRAADAFPCRRLTRVNCAPG